MVCQGRWIVLTFRPSLMTLLPEFFFYWSQISIARVVQETATQKIRFNEEFTYEIYKEFEFNYN